MKRFLQLATVTAVLAVSIATSTSLPAWASPLCSSVHGTACSPNGSTTACTTVDGFPSTCRCSNGHWICKL